MGFIVSTQDNEKPPVMRSGQHFPELERSPKPKDPNEESFEKLMEERNPCKHGCD